MTKVCANCLKSVGFREHLKITKDLVLAKIKPTHVFCTVECAVKYAQRNGHY